MSTDCSDCITANEDNLNSLFDACNTICNNIVNDTEFHKEMAYQCVNNNIGQFNNLDTTCSKWYKDVILDTKKSTTYPIDTIKAVNQVFIDYCTTGDNYTTDECACISSYNGSNLNQYGKVVDYIVSIQPDYTKDNINCWFNMCKCNSSDCFKIDDEKVILKPIESYRDIQPPSNVTEKKCSPVMDCQNIVIGEDGQPMAQQISEQVACGKNNQNLKYAMYVCDDTKCGHTQNIEDPTKGYYKREECLNNCKISPPSPSPSPSPSIPVLNIVLSAVIIIFIIVIIGIVISFSISGGNKKTLYKTSKYSNI